MTKKELLFIIPSLDVGGGEKSLVNLLNQLDYSMYNVDLFLFNQQGLFMSYLPKEVNIIFPGRAFKAFNKPLYQALPSLINHNYHSLTVPRLQFWINNRIKRDKNINEQKGWKYYSQSIQPLEKEYDVSIGFLEKTSIYLCVDKVKAKKKIGFIHNDYEKLGMDPKIDNHYFAYLDHIVTVSTECLTVLNKYFPDHKRKISLMKNIVSPNLIHRMSKENNQVNQDDLTIVSVGRLSKQKGFDMAIKSCKLLVDKGYKIRWLIIGEGEERKKLTSLILKYQLEDIFLLVGVKSNPYPYIRMADIYVQPSRFEGKPIAVDEAKILHKPIVVTNFSTSRDQIEHNQNGLIAEMNVQSISATIEQLINSKKLRKKLTENLKKEKLGTEEEVFTFYKMIHG
ncbi:glycosyltransferase [Bacillus carboniphilus]|uniref:Glycosyltransferase n=1 Tax=Bacillus carboniphilus TaxID=86663 RepID=A0ABY9JTV5_9BACI|nr:glycosyltransferase [Bacillus carboniphilus]WLR42792.1 glycosyltransferase [Bacillus carboniphilus]